MVEAGIESQMNQSQMNQSQTNHNHKEPRVEETTSCHECKSKHLARDYERGELVCSDCGLVLDSNFIDQGPEWRRFGSDETIKRSRGVGPATAPTNSHPDKFSTVIGFGKDAYGRPISASTNMELYRMRKWQRRSQRRISTARNLEIAYRLLRGKASNLGLSKLVRETTSVIYKRAVDKNIIRGRSIEGMLDASLYVACRQKNVPRTLDEIAFYSLEDRKTIGRDYRFLHRELNLELLPTSPKDYVPRYCSNLNCSIETQKIAMELLTAAENKELISGKSQPGVAAAAIYLASIKCDDKVTQRSISEVTGVTEVTIRNRCKGLRAGLGLRME